MLATKPIQGFDLYHQIVRMKTAKNMLDQEVELIMRSLAENVQTYEQVVEVGATVRKTLGHGNLPFELSYWHYCHSILAVCFLSPSAYSISQSTSECLRWSFSLFSARIPYVSKFLSFRTESTDSLSTSFSQIGIQFLQGLNHFHRYAYVRQAHVRESKGSRDQNLLSPPMSNMPSRTPSNRSEASLPGSAV